MIQSRTRRCIAWVAMAIAGISAATVHAQLRDSAPYGPAPILVITREMVRPGEAVAHARYEAQYAAALDAAKSTQYYLGMGAITGTQDSVFVSGYSSLEEMAEVHGYNETLIGGKLDNLAIEHNATLLGVNTSIWRLRPDLSNPITVNLARMRVMELINIHVKLGHDAEMTDVIEHIKEGWLKVDPDFHYSIYQQTFGSATDDSYMVVIPMKSLADVDKHQSMAAEYQKSLGDEEHKRMLAVKSADYNGVESNLFVFTPSMSRLPASWTKDDLDFWKPKPETAVPAKKTATTKK